MAAGVASPDTGAPPPPAAVDTGGGAPAAPLSGTAAEGGKPAPVAGGAEQSTDTDAEGGKKDGAGPSDAEKAAAVAEANQIFADGTARNLEGKGADAALHEIAGDQAPTDGEVPQPAASVAAERPPFPVGGDMAQMREDLQARPADSREPVGSSTPAEGGLASPTAAEGETPANGETASTAQAADAERPEEPAPDAAEAKPDSADGPEQPAGAQQLTDEVKRERANIFLKNDKIDPRYYRGLIRDRIRIKMAEKGITLNEKEIGRQTETEYYRQKAEATRDMGQVNEDMKKNRLWKNVENNKKISDSIKEEAQKRGLDENSQEFKDFQELARLAEYLRLKDQKGPLGLIFRLLAILGYIVMKPMYDQFLEPIATGRR